MTTLARRHLPQDFGIGTNSCGIVRMIRYILRMHLLVTELAGHVDVTPLQDTKTVCHRDGVKVLDLECNNVFTVMLNPDLVQVAIFRLEQEEKGTLFFVSPNFFSFRLQRSVP